MTRRSYTAADLNETRDMVKNDLDAAVSDLLTWWLDTTGRDADLTVPKAVEYGASDLEIMGQALVALGGDLWSGASPQERSALGQEMACAFYAMGKIARVFSAFEQGRRPSDDSWLDITVYSLMARRIRETGRWP